LGLKYKETDYCYSHLTKMKMLPKNKLAVELPKRGRPKKMNQVAPAIVEPALPSALAVASVGQVPQQRDIFTVSKSNLESKLMKRLKDKLHKLDPDIKMLLECLL
jgi:hypothetical protein